MTDDSEGVFGGNGSVEWSVETANNPKWQCSTPKTPKGHMHTGAEETREDAYFTVIVKRPASDADVRILADTLAKWLDELKDAAVRTSSFKLKIESKNYEQIRVTWPSVPPEDNPRRK
jgi:hypothetical protein